MRVRDNITWTGARAPGVAWVSARTAVREVRRLSTQCEGSAAAPGARRVEANRAQPPALGQAPPERRPCSRTGENPTYGMIGETVETSSAGKARSAPPPYPTPRPHAQRTESTPRVRPSGAALQLDPSHRSRQSFSPTGSS